MEKHMRRIVKIISSMILLASGAEMIYSAIIVLVHLAEDFLEEGFYPLWLRPYLIPYYTWAICMLFMLYSGMVSIIEIFRKNNGGRIRFWGLIGLIAIIIPRLLAMLMFGRFRVHYMVIAPICVMVIGFVKVHYIEKQDACVDDNDDE